MQFLPHETIQQIQEKFRQAFSHLKIEFYRSAHLPEEGNRKQDQYLHNVTLQEMSGREEPIVLTLDPNMPTADFERLFEQQYGLHIQVFRQQRGTWLQTTHSDALSLKQQNERGLQADIDIIPEPPGGMEQE